MNDAIPSPVAALSLFANLAEADRDRLRDAIHRLLVHGSILRNEPGQREIYDWCRLNPQWLEELAALLGLKIVAQHENRLIQAVPVYPALLRRLRLDETLVALALWYDYDVAVRDQGAHEVALTVQEFNEKLASKFNALKLPSPSRLQEVLRLLERKNLVRLRWEADFARSIIEVLPTIRFVIPFPDIEEWNRQRDRYLQAAAIPPGGDEADDTEQETTDEPAA